MLRLRDVKKIIDVENPTSPDKNPVKHEENLDFIVWKEELNKELIPFWKSIVKEYQKS